jgi:hypothetical protein
VVRQACFQGHALEALIGSNEANLVFSPKLRHREKKKEAGSTFCQLGAGRRAFIAAKQKGMKDDDHDQRNGISRLSIRSTLLIGIPKSAPLPDNLDRRRATIWLFLDFAG